MLPSELNGDVMKSFIRAIHAFAYAVFLAFCSFSTTRENQISRAKIGTLIGILTSFSLVLLSVLPKIFLGAEPLKQGLFTILFFIALAVGGLGDAIATPALLGILGSASGPKGHQYIGYFGVSISAAYIYVPILCFWIIPLADRNGFFRAIPFALDCVLSILALALLSISTKQISISGEHSPIKTTSSVYTSSKSNPLVELIGTLKSNYFILICVLILAVNQFAFNSLKTASQELKFPWGHIWLVANAILFSIASFIISRWWDKNRVTNEGTRHLVLTALVIILISGIIVILLKDAPAFAAVAGLMFGPFSALLYTGINIYYAEYIIGKGEKNIGSNLGLFSSLYRFLGSFGYLVIALSEYLQHINKIKSIKFLLLLINGVPIFVVILLFLFMSLRFKK
jgi:hypothetical protein